VAQRRGEPERRAEYSGVTNSILTISNVAAGDTGNYDVVVSNDGGSTPSASAALTLVSPSGEIYEAAVLAAKPVAFYQLNETADPAVSALAFDYVGGGVGTYGTGVQNGNTAYNIAGPLSADGFPGFAAGNKAAQFANAIGTSRITISPWNLNTNTVTLTAWINPTAGQQQLGYEGLIFCRGNGTVAGLNYSGVRTLVATPPWVTPGITNGRLGAGIRARAARGPMVLRRLGGLTD